MSKKQNSKNDKRNILVCLFSELHVDSATYGQFRFYYYTAGTGGAGPTILATSFLLLGEEVVAYNKGCCLKSLYKLFILSRLNYNFVCRIK